VRALLPAIKLYPCGTEGRTWVATTVRVSSAARVSITDLFVQPAPALRVLERAWKTQIRRSQPRMWQCAKASSATFPPTAHNYRYFALTPRGLALGLGQGAPTCDRVQGTVPYPILRPYLSRLGATLIAGVRRPRPA
jgi:hypothetical protein